MSEDKISNLPRDAIENILTCLSLRDAVRTSILQRSWRHKWTSLPCLIFDSYTFAGMKRTHDRLLIAMFEVLFQHSGKIEKFVLSLPGLKSCPQIDQLISFVLKNFSLKDFTLHILAGVEPYKLPLSLYSWVEIGRLSLQHCVIEPPISFKGFNKLLSLEITKCSILPDVLSGLISSCQLLEELKVSSPIPTKGDIEISAPNLRKLSFTGDFPLIRVKDAPLLSSCSMSLRGGDAVPAVEVTSVFFKSLCNLPAVQDLQLDYYYAGDYTVDSNNIPRELTTSLIHLRSLTLWNISFGLLIEVSAILCLIRSSPNLVKIVVDAYESWDNSEDVIKLLQVQEWHGVCFNSLREVEFNKILGTTSELDFIELLLTISPKLETLIVTQHPKVELEDGFEILTKMTLLRRSSPLARIVYRKPHFDDIYLDEELLMNSSP